MDVRVAQSKPVMIHCPEFKHHTIRGSLFVKTDCIYIKYEPVYLEPALGVPGGLSERQQQHSAVEVVTKQ